MNRLIPVMTLAALLSGCAVTGTPAPAPANLQLPSAPRSHPVGAAIAGPYGGIEATTAATPGGVSTVVEGINFDEAGANAGFYNIPPDPDGAVGTGHLVSVVNTSIEWHTKAGVQQASQSLATFFAALGTPMAPFDPKVVYDQYLNRFVVVALSRTDIAHGAAGDTSDILLAVSLTDNPNDGWCYQRIDSKMMIDGVNSWADYPGLGVDEDAVYITNNMFAFEAGGGAFKGVRLWVLHKGLLANGLYDCGTSTFTVSQPWASNGFETTTQPAHVFGGAGLPGSGQPGTWLIGYGGLTNGTQEFVQVIRVDNPLAASAPTFSNFSFVQLGDIDSTATAMPDAPQSGTTIKIETNDRRALNAVWRDNSLHVTATVVPGAGADSGQATAWWGRIGTSNAAAPALVESASLGGEQFAAAAHTFFPSVAVNAAGEVAVGYSLSASTSFPSAAVSARGTDDAPGSFPFSSIYAAGTAFYKRTFGGGQNRWGDYTGTAVDPIDGSLWAFNEYALARGTASGEDGRWGTRWVRLPATTDTTPDPFAFVDQDAADPGAVVISEFITPTGYDGAATISVSGHYSARYKIGSGPLTATPGTINPGEQVKVRLLASNVPEEARQLTLNIGGVTSTWTVTTAAGPDDDPDAFSFTNVGSAEAGTVVISEFVTPTGYDTPAPISVSGHSSARYKIGSGPLVSAPGTINPGENVKVRLLADTASGASRQLTLTIGSTSTTWTVTTAGVPDTTPDPFSFPDENNATAGSVVITAFITPTGFTSPASISVSGHASARYKIGSGPLVSAPGTINPGNKVKVRLLASNVAGGVRQLTLNIGGVTTTWTVTTAGGTDARPDPFSFTDVADASPATPVVSEKILLTGFDTQTSIDVSGHPSARYKINSGPLVAEPGMISPGDKLRVRLKSAADAGDSRELMLDVGGETTTWTVTTESWVARAVGASGL
jgi:hypothetical protein